jgi:hypothetical protein
MFKLTQDPGFGKVACVTVDVGPCFALSFPKKGKRPTIMFKLPIDRGVFLTLKPADAKGNPISLNDIDGETIVVTVANPELISAELLEDQTIKVLPLGPLGTTQVNITFTVPGIEVPFTGILEIQTVAGGVATFTVEPGELFVI